ncbi:MAG: double-strand break repair protein AddB, partial [Alphaproteobacteria bacterium]|nr:double-strand break repair protein AddB [Alphaproteobacteria bacterium]
MKEPPARVVTIPANRSFVDVLAAGLLAKTEGDPGALAAHTILLPTRRAVRNLREAFLRASGGQPLLLPRMRPIGDVDEEELILEEEGIGLDLPPAIDPLRRQVMLARMILAKDTAEGGTRDAAQAVALAGALAEFLDRAQAERLSFDALADLVPSDLAAHWQEVLKFLALVTTLWPRVLAERGEIDPADRRNRLIEALAAAWRERPPRKPVIAAGSTG